MRAGPVLRRASAFAAFATCLAMAGPAAARETVDVGVEDAAAPWSQADGTGYANDLVRAGFRAAGVDVRLHVLPYARCKQQVMNGELVSCFSMSPAPELNGVVRFSARPLFVFTCQFFERTNVSVMRRIDDLPMGARVGTVIGYEYPPEVLAGLSRRKATLEAAPTEETNLRKLAAGRIAASIVNRDAVKSSDWVVDRAGVTGRVRSTFSIGSLPAYVGFSMKHPEGRALADRFDRGFARVVASGERDRIEQRWVERAAAAAHP